MDKNPKIYVIDAIMGAGKTSAIINMINNSSVDERFLIITPYLPEVKRFIKSCPKKNFREPFYEGGSKLKSLEKLLEKGQNIVSTHALFQKFNKETIKALEIYGYTLILDEVAEVVQDFYISEYDYDNIMSIYTTVDDKTRQVIWKDEYRDYTGEFEKYKNLCDLGALVCYPNEKKLMVWLFPISIFKRFAKIYVLTYRFNTQMQSCYYRYYNMDFEMLGVKGDNVDNYEICEYSHIIPKYNYKDLIHILSNTRMNRIGENDYSLSKTWYIDNMGIVAAPKTLKNNMVNFFNNIRHGNSDDNMWTTFKDYHDKLKGKNYTKGFVPMNAKATNEHRNRKNIAYMVNRYSDPFVKMFFTSNGIGMDEDGWALSEMLQFIWRSAIRDGKEIWVYIPSKRMRTLLQDWIEEVSLEYKNNIKVTENRTTTTGL